jgi:hypothetical protein
MLPVTGVVIGDSSRLLLPGSLILVGLLLTGGYTNLKNKRR